MNRGYDELVAWLEQRRPAQWAECVAAGIPADAGETLRGNPQLTRARPSLRGETLAC